MHPTSHLRWPPLLQCMAQTPNQTPCTTSDPNCTRCNWNNQCMQCKWGMYLDATKKVRGSHRVGSPVQQDAESSQLQGVPKRRPALQLLLVGGCAVWPKLPCLDSPRPLSSAWRATPTHAWPPLPTARLGKPCEGVRFGLTVAELLAAAPCKQRVHAQLHTWH